MRPLSPAQRRLAPAVLAAVAAAGLFGYAGLGAADRAATGQALALSARLAADDDRLSARMHASNAKPLEAAHGVAGAEALQRMDQAAAEAGVRITRVTPHTPDAKLMSVEVTGEFAGIFRFTAIMEQRHASLGSMQLVPSAATGRLAASFTLDMPAHPAASMAAAGPVAIADPFAQGAPADGGPALHRLTGITRSGAARVATIDGRDYGEGDRMGNMTIGAIGDEDVTLAAGSLRYRLQFAAPVK